MQAQPLETSVLDAWWTLWHEPWRQAHPGWWSVGLNGSHNEGPVPGAADLLSSFRTAGVGSRMAYRWFCRQFGIDAAVAGPRPFPAAQGIELPSLPLAPDDLVAAATALGRVGYASHCLTSSRQGLARLFSQETQTAGDADAWRDALRQARARPLTVTEDLPPPPGGSALELQRWALPLMARLIEDAVPGAWARLRLRFDPQCFTLAPLPPTPYSPALQRQAWRIWRSASQPLTSLAPHETGTPLPDVASRPH